uniref:GPI-anchor transamidase n=1 Tax=Phallusia mammillata TaxID=59560 RepID=A0A6F9DPF4_9ASCI|nr:GPI-anchor transamidase [Phallusia mammillata]
MHINITPLAFLLYIISTSHASLAKNTKVTQEVNKHFSGSSHTNNWAVLVCTSRFWFNYRHVANALSVYRSVKRLGIPDSQIILMLADDMACNPRNPRPGKVYNNKDQAIDVYGSDVEVDYRGYEVTAENFIRVLTGRLPADAPRSKRLSTDDRSNILVYMTGHGGEDFLKFQDAEEISNVELADAFEQMWQRRRYHELLFIIDTCQAVSMFKRFYSPNIMAIASSQVGEDSLSHHVDPAIGVYIIDRYTYHLLEFLERVSPGSKETMEQLFKVCPKHQCISTPGFSTHLFSRPISRTLISDFFGSVRDVDVTDWSFTAKPNPEVVDTNKRTKASGNESANRRYSYSQQFVTKDSTSDRLGTVENTPHPLVGIASSIFLCLMVATVMKTLIS